MDETTETIFEHISDELKIMRKNINTIGRTVSKLIDDTQVLQARVTRLESALAQPS